MSNIKAVIIHGAFRNPTTDWFPWLKTELEKLNIETFAPVFPTPDNQSLDNWLKVFDSYYNKLDHNCILIGHSIGAGFILNILERIKTPIKAVFLVSAFDKLLNNPIVDDINKTFVDKEFDWDKIKNNSKSIYMLSGTEDKYITMDIFQNLASKLNANHTIIEKGGHLNATSGYTEFPLLLDKIKEII